MTLIKDFAPSFARVMLPIKLAHRYTNNYYEKDRAQNYERFANSFVPRNTVPHTHRPVLCTVNPTPDIR